MSHVVIGATGHLGQLTVDSLIERGTEPSEIVAAGRNPDQLADLADKGVRTQRIDLSNGNGLADLFTPGDTLLLISGSEIGQRIAQHGRAIDAANAAGVARVVYTSAPKADTSALLVAPEHKATEELIVASGLPFTILRNGWYTENYLQDLEQARNTGTLLTSAGEGLVASASRKDYAEAAAVALLDGSTAGKVYELSGDTAWSQAELAAAIADTIDSDVAVRAVTPDEHQHVLLEAGLDEGTAGFVVGLQANTRDGLLAATTGELSEMIGRPTTPLRVGLSEAAGVSA